MELSLLVADDSDNETDAPLFPIPRTLNFLDGFMAHRDRFLDFNRDRLMAIQSRFFAPMQERVIVRAHAVIGLLHRPSSPLSRWDPWPFLEQSPRWGEIDAAIVFGNHLTRLLTRNLRNPRDVDGLWTAQRRLMHHLDDASPLQSSTHLFPQSTTDADAVGDALGDGDGFGPSRLSQIGHCCQCGEAYRSAPRPFGNRYGQRPFQWNDLDEDYSDEDEESDSASDLSTPESMPELVSD